MVILPVCGVGDELLPGSVNIDRLFASLTVAKKLPVWFSTFVSLLAFVTLRKESNIFWSGANLLDLSFGRLLSRGIGCFGD